MSDPAKVPYRDPAEPEARPPAPPRFERPWCDARAAGTSWAIYQVAFMGVFASGLLAAAWPPLGVAGVAGVGAWLYARGRRRTPLLLQAEVVDGVATVRFRGEPVLVAPLAAIVDIVVDSSEIQRVTYHQAVGDPLPSTQVSGDVQVGRLVARLDDGRAVRLTETAESYSACMETFGKLRVFLRAHGWKPADER